GDVVVPMRDVPQARKHEKQNRVDDDRVRNREEGKRAGAERQGGDRNERVGGIEIAADEKPRDDRAEAAAAETPFVQLIEVSLAPIGRGEAEPRDEAEQQDENGERCPVDLLQRDLPWSPHANGRRGLWRSTRLL